MALPGIVRAQAPLYEAPFYYTIDSGVITITGYNGSGGSVVIPYTINGLLVTSLGKGVTHYAEVVIMRRSASADAELADGCGLSVSRGLRQLHIIPIKYNPLGSGIPASEIASQNGLGTH